MALLIELERRPHTELRTEIDTRMWVALYALDQYLRGYFEPTDFEIWQSATLTNIGGKKIVSVPLDIGDIHQLRKEILQKTHNLRYPLLFESIVRINGIWKLDGIEQRGFFSINNSPAWRRVYGDIDVDVYPNKTADDLTSLFWKNDQLRRRLVDQFFEDFVVAYRKYRFNEYMLLKWICFAYGVPTRRDVSSITAAYYGQLKSFISDSFQTFRDAQPWVQRSVNLKYIVDRAYEEREFKNAVNNTLKGFHISKIEGHSIILIGQKKDSFNKLYEQFSEEYLKPIFKKLPTDNKVKSIVKEIVTKQERLFDN